MSVIAINKVLISPAEVVKLSKEQGTVGTIDIVTEIEKAWGTQYDTPLYNYYCMLSAVYTAGYIQGKREERTRKRTRSADT